MARLLIVGGGCRGLELAGSLIEEGYAVRIVTRMASQGARSSPSGPSAGSATLTAWRRCVARWRESLLLLAARDRQWLLGAVRGASRSASSSLPRSAIDTTARGVIYEAVGASWGRRYLGRA